MTHTRNARPLSIGPVGADQERIALIGTHTTFHSPTPRIHMSRPVGNPPLLSLLRLDPLKGVWTSLTPLVTPQVDYNPPPISQFQASRDCLRYTYPSSRHHYQPTKQSPADGSYSIPFLTHSLLPLHYHPPIDQPGCVSPAYSSFWSPAWFRLPVSHLTMFCRTPSLTV
jgi:hypothetical protein